MRVRNAKLNEEVSDGTTKPLQSLTIDLYLKSNYISVDSTGYSIATIYVKKNENDPSVYTYSVYIPRSEYLPNTVPKPKESYIELEKPPEGQPIIVTYDWSSLSDVNKKFMDRYGVYIKPDAMYEMFNFYEKNGIKENVHTEFNFNTQLRFVRNAELQKSLREILKDFKDSVDEQNRAAAQTQAAEQTQAADQTPAV